jgi:ketosteroid isomerase-like protein
MTTTDPTTAPTTSGAADIVRSVYRAFTSGDTGLIDRTVRELFADDVVVHEAESLPWGGRYDGLDTVAAMTQGLADPAAPIDAANLTIDELIVDESGAPGTSHVIAAVSFPWRGATTIPMRALEWFTIRDGKVSEIQVFLWDTGAAVSALGNGLPKGIDRDGAIEPPSA